MPRLAAIFITHTHERIARSVMSMAAQTTPPDRIVVSCDADTPAIRAEVRRTAERIGRPVLLVVRPHTGEARPAQARNNAVRALAAESGLGDDDRLVFFDGDCLAPPRTLRTHLDALDRAHLSLGWRIELTELQTAGLTDEGILGGTIESLPTAVQREELRRAAKSHRRRAVLRLLSLTKPHKPQVLGCNFGVRAWVYRAVNGMDETFTGWGMEDDDLGRRVYALGGLAALRVRSCPVLHQHHPTRSPGPWIENRQARRIDRPFPTVCTHGLRYPVHQPEPTAILLDPNGETGTDSRASARVG
jgi:GT2 family glycosyltransferase